MKRPRNQGVDSLDALFASTTLTNTNAGPTNQLMTNSIQNEDWDSFKSTNSFNSAQRLQSFGSANSSPESDVERPAAGAGASDSSWQARRAWSANFRGESPAASTSASSSFTASADMAGFNSAQHSVLSRAGSDGWTPPVPASGFMRTPGSRMTDVGESPRPPPSPSSLLLLPPTGNNPTGRRALGIPSPTAPRRATCMSGLSALAAKSNRRPAAS